MSVGPISLRLSSLFNKRLPFTHNGSRKRRLMYNSTINLQSLCLFSQSPQREIKNKIRITPVAVQDNRNNE